ncbi:hypothetical protein GRF61_05240 [Azoarcus sp. TTM-91]|uniref:hypothetical protein n=1 Tax=Azoarcus sp. TTM-91 TaxID=2691581 RepID=UPI00145D8EB7|nr:hypothetical protein [Azoarcus sp. TTM-91]NMG33854.1 hypothetical protein [Azoarcus sp. TTM-91]
MRSIQVLMLSLCVLGGLYLLTQAPSFFMPDRSNPALGRLFDPLSSRLLGAGLLAAGWAGVGYMGNFYYRGERRLPGPRGQRQHFIAMVLALGLIAAAFSSAEPGPDPDRPAASRPQR